MSIRATVNPPVPEYVLGTGQDELDRLGLQHRLWSDAAHAAWRLARIQPGSRVLDVGCGPGYAAMDIAQLVAPTGEVVGVDESPNFIAYLNDQAKSRRLAHTTGVQGDVQNLPSVLAAANLAPQASRPEPLFDVAYARWVLCFVPRPQDVVTGVAQLLKPGGRFVVHDYFNYATMTTAPRRSSHDKAVAATIKSWKDRGGDPDICGRLPQLMKAAGLRVTHIVVHQRTARKGDSMLHWPVVWWRTYTPKLVQMGYLMQSDADELLRDLAEIERSDTDYVLVPPVFEIVAEKIG